MIFKNIMINKLVGVLFILNSFNSIHANSQELAAQFVYKTIGKRQLVVDVDYPKDHAVRDARPAIVLFAGGAWRGGSTKQFQSQAEMYAGAGLVAIRAEYRGSIIDKVQVDSCVEDAISAIRWVRKNAKRLGIDPCRIVAAGGSAGGFLAASTWTTEGLNDKKNDTAVSAKPDALVLFNPVFDLVPFMEKLKMDPKQWTEKAKQISPLWNIKTGIPPTVILIGTKDEYLSQSEDFREKACPLGVKLKIQLYQGQPHAFFNRSPWREKTVEDSLKFLRVHGLL